MNDSAAAIRAFLAESFGSHDLKDDEDIFSLGYVSSLFVMDLVQFVEGTFGIAVEREDLSLDNFRTVRAMVDLARGAGAALRGGWPGAS